MNKIVNIAGVPFPIINYDGVIEVFQQWIDERKSSQQVCIVNVHTLVSTMRDPVFHSIMQQAGMNTMDGQPLKWYANSVCQVGLNERVCGPELMLRCLEQGIERDWQHYSACRPTKNFGFALMPDHGFSLPVSKHLSGTARNYPRYN